MIFNGTIYSYTLEMDTGLAVVAPNAARRDGRYKVAYLLHGLKGSTDSWVGYSMLPAYAAGGDTIYVMPEVARSFYTDMKYGLKYFSYVADELPAICESLFNISAAREDTAVIGCSMGGYGALKCAFTRPERYGMCAAFSSSCLSLRAGFEYQRQHGMDAELVERWGPQLPLDFVNAFGPELQWTPDIDILALAEKIGLLENRPALYLACGSEDPFLEENRLFAAEMRKREFNITYDEWDGGHTFAFFDAALKRAIEAFDL